MKKVNLLKTLTSNTIVLFLLFATLLLVINYYISYQKYKKDSQELRTEHIQVVKDSLKWEVKHYIELIEITKINFENAKKRILKNQITQIHDLSLAIYNENKDKRSITEIQNIILSALRKVRLQNQGYYFIFDTNGVEILNVLSNDFKGKSLLNQKNSDGIFVAKNMIKLAQKQKEGFYTYNWQKPNNKGTGEKTSYIKLLEPLGWVIGTGVYKDDIERATQNDILSNIELMKLNQKNDNYIFIATWKGISLTYPAKGKDMYMAQDKNGKFIVQELIKTSKNGGGFVEYIMPNLKDEKSSKKISYVKAIPEWQWYVGAGLYTDDINEEITILENKMYNELVTTLVITLILSAFILMLFTIFYKKLTSNLQNDFSIFINFFNSLVIDSKKIDINSIKFNEFNNMVIHANEMLEEKLELEDSLEKYKKIVSTSGDFLSLVDKNYVYQAVNDTYLKFFDKKREEIVGHSASEIFGKDFFESKIKAYNDKALNGETFTREVWFNFPTSRRCLQTKYFPYKKENEEKAEFFVVSARDITNQKLAGEKLKLWQRVFENTSEAVMVCDANEYIVQVNNSFSRITGYGKKEAIGQKSSFISYNANKKIENLNSICDTVKELGSWYGEVINKKKNGTTFPALLSANAVLDERGNPANYIAVFSDITKLKESEHKLEFLAHHDSLTNLPNRTLLKDRITQAIANAKRNQTIIAVCFIDLDNFKKVNDTFGHSYGDDILKQCAVRIKKEIRETDTLSRIGGDEFILLLENLNNTEEVNNIISKIQRTLQDQFISKNAKFVLSASVGICFYPLNGCTSDELIKNADIAMYKAKESGKNTYKFFTSQMAEATHKTLDMENDLIEAIKYSQFLVYYQPQINLKTKETIGLEALIRWNHPVKGVLSPAHFIEASEDNKMIIPIGKYVLKKSCEDLIYLQKNINYKGKVSVNVSGIQVEHSDFLKTLEDIIKETKIDPTKLELEITESVIMHDPQQWIDLLCSIRNLGVTIAIDDFGTGYSSLSYLRKLPIDKLKIDMTFINDIPQEEDACSIVNSIINLSSNMKMTTLAEGIENVEQEKYLSLNNCKEGQGYLYAKPMPLNILEEWIEDKNK